MSMDLLLSVLADGEFHSGEELGAALGVSRAAVWKQIKKIESLLGFELESLSGKGYRIAGGLDLLDHASVLGGLSVAVREKVSDFELLPVAESTNRVVMEKTMAGAESGYLCAAEKQTAGRGRRGRVWHSPFGKNLYFSLSWQFTGGAASLEGLSLAIGVVVNEVFAEMGISGVQLKWPNDLLYENKKLAGILLEMVGDASGVCQVVIGIGINVDMSDLDNGAIDQPWTDLRTAGGRPVSRNDLLAALVEKLVGLLGRYEKQGFKAYRSRWLEMDAFAGQSVQVLVGQRVVDGKASGVDESGALQVCIEGELQSFNGGEISLRKLT